MGRLLIMVETSETGPFDNAQYYVVIAIGVKVSLNAINPSDRLRYFMCLSCRSTLGRTDKLKNIPKIQNALTENMFQKEK